MTKLSYDFCVCGKEMKLVNTSQCGSEKQAGIRTKINKNPAFIVINANETLYKI